MFIIKIIFLALCFVLAGCQGKTERAADYGTDFQPSHAQLIPLATMVESSDGTVAVDASVYRGLMSMLGIGHRCIDFSSEMKPDAEKVAMAKPQMFLLSAYEGNESSKYERMGINVIECRDFLEQCPLARAEWMRYFGRLWGVAERADSLFLLVEQEYRGIISEISENSEYSESSESSENSDKFKGVNSPKVFFDLLYGNLWYQPTPTSTIGQMVGDAGGEIPFTTEQKGGSLALSAEQVLVEAGDADVWMIRYAAKEDLTLSQLKEMSPVYSQFKAFKNGQVYACNTFKKPFYEETPFRPDWLLSDFITILHPELAVNKTLRYFDKVK